MISDYEGEVYVNGINLKEDVLLVKSGIGYVPELAELYDVLTPSEFLHFTRSLYGMRAEITDERIQPVMAAFGMEQNIHQCMDSFSKGMR